MTAGAVTPAGLGDVQGNAAEQRDDQAGTVAPVAELFTHAVSALWVTTYNLDLALFNEFLLPRLGEPPLNVTVLADHRRLAAGLDRVPLDRVGTLDRVNRRWLLRGVRFGAGAFHPKTYLAVAGRRVTLLVGSGNLSRSGLDEGHEVFTSFASGTPAGDAAIATWLGWMARIVRATDDTAILERFEDLRSRLGQLNAGMHALPTSESPLLHNLDVPLADQLVAMVHAGATDTDGMVDELILTAPFYDPDAHAVGRLLADLTPRLVRIFVTPKMSVRGDQLAARLTASGARIQVIRYPPDKFIHAKLVGVIVGARGWLLSGSPNLSQAALTQTALSDPPSSGNVEVAVLASLPAPAVRAAFHPPHLSTTSGSLETLTPLGFRADPEPELPSVRLLAAKALREGRIEVTCSPPPQPGWQLTDLIVSQPLLPIDLPSPMHPDSHVGTGVTTDRLTGRLVLLVDADNAPLSNRVVVDDPGALAATLVSSTERPSADRPSELAESDLDSPLGRALVRLDRAFLLDVNEAVGGSGRGPADDGETEQDEDFWDRLEREQIARDSRAAAYWQTDEYYWLDSDPLIELLEALRHRAPGDPPPRSFLSAGPDDRDATNVDSDDTPKRRWKPATRIRVRARNLLRRWADAQTDPRLAFVHPLAPARNFAAIVFFLRDLRWDRSVDPEQVELTDDDLDEIWLRWLLPIVGTGRRDGWLDRLDDAERTRALQALPDDLAVFVAALCWLAIRPGDADGHRARVIKIQPALRGAGHHGLVEPTDLTAEYLSRITGHVIGRMQVAADLRYAATFLDDQLWCTQTRTELTLDRLWLEEVRDHHRVQFRLHLTGVAEPLLDPRIPRLIAAFRDYRRFGRVQIFAGEGWRVVVDDGAPIAYLPGLDRDGVESTLGLTDDLLRSLTRSDAVLADLFDFWPWCFRVCRR